MNGPHTKMYVKDNPFTRLIDRVTEINVSEGKQVGIGAAHGAENYLPAIPAAQLARMTPGQIAAMEFVPPPLSPEQVMRANAQAAALGIVDADELGMPGEMGVGPTEEEIEAMLPRRFQNRPSAPPRSNVGQPQPDADVIPSGRPMAAAQGIFNARSLPNFKNVQGFNLERGVAVVDGIEFPLPDEDVLDMKKYALSIVLDMMVIQVAQALVEFGLPQEMAEAAAQKLRETAAASAAVPGAMANAGKDQSPAGEAVSSVSSGTSTGTLSSGSVAPGRPVELVQELSPDMEYFLDATLAETSVQEDSSGSGEPSPK